MHTKSTRAVRALAACCAWELAYFGMPAPVARNSGRHLPRNILRYHSAPMWTAHKLCRFVMCAQIAVGFSASAAESGILGPGDVLMIQASPKVFHFDSDPDHVKYSWMVGVEWQRPSNWLAGYSYFNNSFGQKCHYLYGGKSWRLGDSDSNWYFKLTGGVIIGYKDPFEDKIPFNSNGIAPGIVPGLGYRINRFNVQANLLGVSALMITVGYDLFR